MSSNNHEYVNSEYAVKCLNTIYAGLNRANKTGAFSLDESFELKTAVSAIEKALVVHSEGQKRLIELEKPDFSQTPNLPANLKVPQTKGLTMVKEETETEDED